MEWVEREVGGGIGMGNGCKPLAVSFQCMTKSTTNEKKKKKKKKKKDSSALLPALVKSLLFLLRRIPLCGSSQFMYPSSSDGYSIVSSLGLLGMCH